MSTSTSSWPLATRYGLITGVALAVIALILQQTGISDPTKQNTGASLISSLLTFAITYGGIHMADNAFKSMNNGYGTFNQLFGVGFKVSLIAGIIGAIWAILYFQVIDPGIMDRIMEGQMEQMLEKGMSEEDAERAMSMTSKFTSPPIIAAFSLVGSVIIGCVLSLIAAAILKKDPTNTKALDGEMV